MSGKSGQLLTSSFYDDCESIVLENGVPTLRLSSDMRGFGVTVPLSQAVESFGISERVFRNLRLLAGVPVLHVEDNRNDLELLLSFSGFLHDKGIDDPAYGSVQYARVADPTMFQLFVINFDPQENEVFVGFRN